MLRRSNRGPTRATVARTSAERREPRGAEDGSASEPGRPTRGRQPRGTSPRGLTFHRFAESTANRTGQPAVFGLAVGLVVVWAATGPIFDYSETWQLVINTGTTIITFLMVFLIQNTQNRDAHAVQLKLDELIRALDGADDSLLDLEDLDDVELEVLRRRYEQLAASARARLDRDPPPEPTDATALALAADPARRVRSRAARTSRMGAGGRSNPRRSSRPPR